MRTDDLRALLDRLDDTGEIVVLRQRTDGAMRDAWLDAREEAQDAYREWQRDGGTDAYVTYVAAQDRADAAQDMLALEPA
jgi:hypothetical protein